MSNTKTGYPEIEDIREDLDSLKNNVVELTKHVQKNGAEHTKEATRMLRSRLDHFKKSGQDQLYQMEKQVKAKPMQSLALAFAAGMLASLVIGRR